MHVIARRWSALVMLLIVASGSAVGVLAACAATATATSLNGWTDTLIDTHVGMSAYLRGRDSMRDAIEVSGAPAEACNPARAQEWYERISRDLTALIAEAPQFGFDKPTMDALSRIKANWELLERRRRSHWKDASGVEDLDPIEHCLRPSAFADLRVEMDDDMSTVLKAAVRKLAQK